MRIRLGSWMPSKTVISRTCSGEARSDSVGRIVEWLQQSSRCRQIEYCLPQLLHALRPLEQHLEVRRHPLPRCRQLLRSLGRRERAEGSRSEVSLRAPLLRLLRFQIVEEAHQLVHLGDDAL